MAVTRRTLRLMRMVRIQLDDTVDKATEDLVKAWARAWDTLIVEWGDAVDELVRSAARAGRWPNRSQILRVERAMKALDLTRNLLEDLADNAGVRILRDVPAVVDQAGAHVDVIASQCPSSDSDLLLAVTLDRPSAEQLRAIVARTTQQVTSLLRPLSAEATTEMYRSLVRGVAMGTNPRVVARRLIRRLEGNFNGGLTRAMVVARTEMLDAHREAARVVHDANADVLAGWQWSATLDARTCPSCWAQHGLVHPLLEPGPLDHQQGRCARLPVLKSWSELGLGDDEPNSVLPDAEASFRSLPRADQLQVMGSRRLALLDSGDVSWLALTSRRSTRGWRDSWTATPVRDLAPS
jgi:hypothetical protein